MKQSEIFPVKTDRKFKGYASVAVRDKQGEEVSIDGLARVMDIWFKRGAPITDSHSNFVVGHGLTWGRTKIQNADAIWIEGEIFSDYKRDDKVWENIRDGHYKGLSIGGDPLKAERVCDGESCWNKHTELELAEIAAVADPANQLAFFFEKMQEGNKPMSEIAKADQAAEDEKFKNPEKVKELAGDKTKPSDAEEDKFKNTAGKSDNGYKEVEHKEDMKGKDDEEKEDKKDYKKEDNPLLDAIQQQMMKIGSIPIYVPTFENANSTSVSNDGTVSFFKPYGESSYNVLEKESKQDTQKPVEDDCNDCGEEMTKEQVKKEENPAVPNVADLFQQLQANLLDEIKKSNESLQKQIDALKPEEKTEEKKEIVKVDEKEPKTVASVSTARPPVRKEDGFPQTSLENQSNPEVPLSDEEITKYARMSDGMSQITKLLEERGVKEAQFRPWSR